MTHMLPNPPCPPHSTHQSPSTPMPPSHTQAARAAFPHASHSLAGPDKGSGGGSSGSGGGEECGGLLRCFLLYRATPTDALTLHQVVKVRGGRRRGGRVRQTCGEGG